MHDAATGESRASSSGSACSSGRVSSSSAHPRTGARIGSPASSRSISRTTSNRIPLRYGLQRRRPARRREARHEVGNRPQGLASRSRLTLYACDSPAATTMAHFCGVLAPRAGGAGAIATATRRVLRPRSCPAVGVLASPAAHAQQYSLDPPRQRRPPPARHALGREQEPRRGANAQGLKNLGCRRMASLDQWARMTRPSASCDAAVPRRPPGQARLGRRPLSCARTCAPVGRNKSRILIRAHCAAAVMMGCARKGRRAVTTWVLGAVMIRPVRAVVAWPLAMKFARPSSNHSDVIDVTTARSVSGPSRLDRSSSHHLGSLPSVLASTALLELSGCLSAAAGAR